MKPNQRVVVYGSLGLRKGISDLLWAFRKSSRLEEFPAYLDDHPFQVIARIRSEVKNDLPTADIVLMPHYAVEGMGREGMLAGYRPAGIGRGNPRASGLGAGAIPIGVTFMAMAYNTRTLKRRDLPNSLGELSDGSWGGKLGTQSLTASRSGNLGAWYLSFLRRGLGEKGWRTFVDSLARGNRPAAYDCIDHLLQGLMGGEIKLALTVYSLAYFREKTAGSPVALVDKERIPHMMTFTSAALLKGAEENQAAKRFLDFLLTPEAQKVLGAIPGIAPVSNAIKPSYDFEHSYGNTTEFHPDTRDFEELTSALRVFRELGLP